MEPPSNPSGPYGRATRIALPDIPKAAQTVAYWLLDAPHYHPFWSQYVLAVVRLDDVPGFPPPVLHFDGATHELHVVAINPEGGTLDEHMLTSVMLSGGSVGYLFPISVAHQFTATDDEMRSLAAWCAYGVTVGALNPETGDAPAAIREAWLGSCVKTLAHMRGEEHSR